MVAHWSTPSRVEKTLETARITHPMISRLRTMAE